MIDLLKLINEGGITVDEAYEILDETIDRFHQGEETRPWWEMLCMDRYEATANAHGASLEDLVAFRYQGWPTICHRCKEPIDYTDFGWWYEPDANDRPTLRHIVCPSQSSREDEQREKGSE